MQRVKNAIYRLVARLSSISEPSVQPRTLLIIRTDEIGDYVLWRNTLSCIRNSSLYRDHHITLLGNAAWKDLALNFDAGYADEFIWLDKKKFKSSMRYRYHFLRSVRSRGFEKLINTVFSRSPRVDDAIVAVCTSSYKIAMQRNEHNVAAFEKGYDKGLYQEIHELPLTGLFEFDRNKKFASLILKEACEPAFGLPNGIEAGPVSLPARYAVIFPGSGRRDRRWKPENFAAIAEYLHEEKKLPVVLAGGPGDKEAAAGVAALLSFQATDLTGETTLSQFAGLLARAELLVSVDTGAVHLAAAVGCKVYGLFNGDQYGRFSPYPAGLLRNSFYAIYPDELEKKQPGGNDLYEKYQYFSGFDVNTITPEKVIKVLSNG